MSSKMLQLNLSPSERTLKQFGFVALGVFGLLATCALYETWLFSFGLGASRVAVACALAAIGVLSSLFSLAWPKGNTALFLGLTVASYPIGLVMSYVTLGVLFFGIVAPIGGLLRLTGKDPMQRGLRKDERSYWSSVRANRTKESYFRQF